MTDNRTTELREAARNIQGNLGRSLYRRKDVDEMQCVSDMLFYAANTIESLREGLLRDRLQAATLGINRDEIYNAGFDSGVKATLQQLNGLIVSGYDLKAVCAWIDEQWKDGGNE